MAEIKDLNESWSNDHDGDEVEAFIKKGIKTAQTAYSERAGDFHFDSQSNTLLAFKNTEDKELWLETNDSPLIVATVPFNFTGVQNQVKVLNGMASGNLFFTTQAKEAKITCSFISQEKGITDANWNDVNEDFFVSVFVDKGNIGVFEKIINEQSVLNGNQFTFDIKPSIATGANRIRVVAVGKESGASGSFTYTVNLTTMYLAPSNFTWYLPFVEGKKYVLGGLNIGGNLQKVLRIRVTKEETYIKEYEVNIGENIYVTNAFTYSGLEFPTAGSGVYNVEMWLDANGLTSEHLSYNIICVAKQDEATAQIVSVSDNPEKVLNFTENKLFDYCIYNCGLTTGSPTISLDVIVNTNANNIKTETLMNVPTGQALNYTTSLEVEVAEAKMQLSATMTYGNIQQVVYPIDNSKSHPATSESVFYLNPSQRNNAQADREHIINAINSEHYEAEWTNMSWVDGVDGWTVDDEGRKCLLIPAFSKCNIAYQPIADNRTPFTMEFLFKVKNASDYNDPVIAICENADSYNFNGVRITPKNICLHSINLKDSSLQDYNMLDEKIMDVIVTIIPNYKTNYGNLAQIYCNGVKVRSFEFSSISEWNTKSNIILGNNTSDLYFYKMYVYRKGFDKTDAMRNSINALPNVEQREEMYNRLLSVTDDSYNLSYDTCVKNGYNTMVIEMLNGKEIPSLLNQEEGLLCNLKINIHNLIEGELDEEMSELLCGKEIINQVIEGQGTTAMTYGRWNFRWKLDGTYGKRRITAKKNVASSMHDNKMGATRAFNYLHEYCVGMNEAGADVAVGQYPVLGYQKVLQEDGKTYIYRPIGLYTIGADKGDKKTFGYDDDEFEDTLIHMEGSDHTPKSVGFDYPWSGLKYSSKKDVESLGAVVSSDGSIVAAWEVGAAGQYETDSKTDESNIQKMLDDEFKPAYNVAYKNSPFIMCVDESVDEMNADIESWQNKTDAYGEYYSAYEFFNKTNGNVIYYDVMTKQYEEQTDFNLFADLELDAASFASMTNEEATEAVVSARKQRFVNEWGNYWHKDDTIFHYVFMLIFAATDNYKKNTYPYKFASLSAGGKWRWRADDLDTIFDINNQGLAAKIYSVLVGDKTETGSVYRGDNSALWTLIRITQGAEIKNMVHRIFDAMIAHPKAKGTNTLETLVSFVKYFFWSFAQEYFPESAYNADAEWTYEDIWANKNAWKEVNPLSQALGGHYEAQQDWVQMRMLFLSSFYNYGAFDASGYNDTSTGSMVYGGASAHTYHITPAIDMNPTIIRGSTEIITNGKRVKANETVPLTVSNTTGADTRIYVQGLDWIKDIGDLSQLTVSAGNPTLNVSSKRLQGLKIGDEDASKIPTSGTIKGLEFGECPSMTIVDARNVGTLTGTVDLTRLSRLKEAYLGGTDVKVLRLKDGSKVEKIEIPDSLTTLKLKDLKFIFASELNDVEEGLSDFTKGKYISDTNNVGEVLKVSYGSDGASYYKSFEVRSYSDIIITGHSSASYWLWCFVDANGIILSKSGKGVTATNEKLAVPEGAVLLYVNFYTYQYSGDSTIVINHKAGLIYNTLKNLSSLQVENSNIDGFALMKKAYNEEDSKLGQIRVVGFEKDGDATDLTMLSNMVNDINAAGEAHIFTGIDSEGNVTDHPVIEGTINIPTPVYKEDVDILREAYGNALVMNFGGGYYIRFQDENVLQVLLANGVGDGTGITTEQAEAVTSIGTWFNGNTTIESFDELEKFTGVTSIAASGFHGCTNLSSINLSNIENLGKSAFLSCSSLAGEIRIPKLKGVITNATFKGTNITSITDLGEITGITNSSNASESPFGYITTLNKVVIPDTLETFGGYVFDGCTSLSEINFPNAVKTIGTSAFYNCTSLEIEELNLPNLETLGQNAFYGVKIKKMVLGKLTALPTTSSSTQNYGDRSVLEELVLSNGIKNIPQYSFLNYTSLANIYVDWASLEIINSYAFKSIPAPMEIDCPNLTSIGLAAFTYCVGLTKIVNLGKITETPNTPSGTNEGLFKGCVNLKDVILPETLSKIGAYAFSDCPALTNIELPSSVTIIEKFAFYNTPIGGDLILPNLTVMYMRAFGNTNIRRILDLGSITSLVGNNNYNSFGVFYTCEMLELAILPETLTSLGGYAIRNCSMLNTVICKASTPPSTTTQCFGGSLITQTSGSIYVPDDSVTAYKEASGWIYYVNVIKPISQLATDNPSLYEEVADYL